MQKSRDLTTKSLYILIFLILLIEFPSKWSQTCEAISTEQNYNSPMVSSTPTYVPSSNGLPTSGQWPYDTRIGDVNHDGHLDIIRLRGHDDFNPEDKGFQIWLGDGAGNWTKTSIPNGNFGYGGTAVGDFNNDGLLDAAYGVHHNGNHPLIGAWIGDGGTSFTEQSTGLAMDGETWGMAPIDFGDFNNDGWLDIGVGSFGASNGIRAYENLNQGSNWISRSTGLPHNNKSPNAGNRFLWEDLNRDGFLDILMAIQYVIPQQEHHLIWLGDGTGNWTNNDFSLPIQWLWGAYGLDTGDVNNDGWPDVTLIKKIGSAYLPVVYVFNGSVFTEASTGLPTTGEYLPLTFGDLDNDGNLDLVGLEVYNAGNYYTTIHAWLGDGTGRWSEIPIIATGIPGSPESVTLADIDHNNYLDMILTSDIGDYEPGGIRVYKNTNPVSGLSLTLRQPLGGQVFIQGGIRKIYWTSSIPSGTGTVSLQYSLTGSQGPWYPIVEQTIDSNSYQWAIPNVNSNAAYLKATVHWNGQTASAITPRPFTILGDNTPPDPPALTGPTTGKPKEQYDYSILSNDPDGDQVFYQLEWGDGMTSEWIGPVPSGSPVKIHHAWERPGIYMIRGKVKDIHGVETSWSDPLSMTISIASLDVTLKGGLGIKIILKNTGAEELNRIPWNITVKGGMILLGRSHEGIFSVLKAGEEKTIYSSILGFGKISLMVNVQDVMKNTTGLVFFFFALGIK